MKALHLRLVSSTGKSVIITWSSTPPLSSSGSSSSLLHQRTRLSRSSLSSDDHKVSRASLGSGDTSARKYLRTPIESIEDVVDSAVYDSEALNEEARVFYTLQMKDRLLGWTCVYRGYKNQIVVSPLTPAEVFHFRIRASTPDEDSAWSEILTTSTKDDIISAAPLHRALDQSHLTGARKVLSLRAGAAEVPNKLGRTALQVATLKPDLPLCSMLLVCGADVNAREMASLRTPLMNAAYRGETDMLNMLTERGANWADTDRFGQSALHYCCMQTCCSAILTAITLSPDINAKDNSGWSPLMVAVSGPKTTKAIVEILIDRGADVNSQNNRRQTVLMQAILSQASEIAKVLIQKGANVASRNCENHSAYDFADQKGMTDLLPLLEHKDDCSNSPGEISQPLDLKKEQVQTN